MGRHPEQRLPGLVNGPGGTSFGKDLDQKARPKGPGVFKAPGLNSRLMGH